MQGPYTARIIIDRQDAFLLEESELNEGSKIAERYYQDATPALVEGALRSAVFTAALLLDPGCEAEIEIHGFVGGQPTLCRTDRARRDDRGRFHTTLGSRFSERVFQGA